MTGDRPGRAVERATAPRVLGLVEGDPASALSGVGRQLLDALDRRLPVVARLDYAPHGAERAALAAATFRPDRARWRGRFHTSRLSERRLTGVLARRLAALDVEFDVALQVHGWVRRQPEPYVLYVDQTRLMAEEGWPAWLPLPRRERATVLAHEREMYRGAAHVFTMGERTRAALIRDYGLDPARATAVGGGVRFDPLPAVERPPDAGPRVLFVGREFERKGGPVLLEAFALLRAALPTAALDVVGPARAPRRLPPGVSWHGRVADPARLAALYRGAAAFCLPTLYEPYGLVLLEAMAHGVPCVASRVQAIPEILDEGRAGLLVPPGDPRALAEALTVLLTDRERSAAVGRAGRARVEAELTWDRVVDRMLPVLDGLHASVRRSQNPDG